MKDITGPSTTHREAWAHHAVFKPIWDSTYPVVFFFSLKKKRNTKPKQECFRTAIPNYHGISCAKTGGNMVQHFSFKLETEIAY